LQFERDTLATRNDVLESENAVIEEECAPLRNNASILLQSTCDNKVEALMTLVTSFADGHGGYTEHSSGSCVRSSDSNLDLSFASKIYDTTDSI
jgi:hypothetical protein